MTDHRIRAAHQRPNATNDQIRLLPDELDFGNNLGFDYSKAPKSCTPPPKEEASEENWIDRASVQPYLIAFLCLFSGAMLAVPIVAFTRTSSPTSETVEEVGLPPAKVAPQLTLQSVAEVPVQKLPGSLLPIPLRYWLLSPAKPMALRRGGRRTGGSLIVALFMLD
jgi:hypothetical protein